MNLREIMLFSVICLLGGCSYTGSQSNYSEGSDVGGTGDIKYDHDGLGGGKHFLTVTAAPGIMETEGSIAQRIHIFANKYAAITCPDSFEFVHDPNFDQNIAAGFMKRTKSYVFQCGS